MLVSLFEDETFENFLPLAYTKPVFELKSGMFTFRERTQKVFQDYPLILSTRDYLASTLKRSQLRREEKQELLNADWSYSCKA